MSPMKKKDKNNKSLAGKLLPGSSRPSVPAQVQVQEWLGVDVQLAATSAGAMALSFAPSLSSLTYIASYKNIYDEYRIVGIEWIVRALDPTKVGTAKIYVDDSDVAVPTLASTVSRAGKLVSMSDVWHAHTFKYRSQNITDLTWLDTNTASTQQYAALKIFSNAANFGGSAVSLNVFVVETRLHVQFRGIGAA